MMRFEIWGMGLARCVDHCCVIRNGWSIVRRLEGPYIGAMYTGDPLSMPSVVRKLRSA